jgi:hypothetical protein
MDHLERLIRLQDQRLMVVERQFEADLKVLVDEFDDERNEVRLEGRDSRGGASNGAGKSAFVAAFVSAFVAAFVAAFVSALVSPRRALSTPPFTQLTTAGGVVSYCVQFNPFFFWCKSNQRKQTTKANSDHDNGDDVDDKVGKSYSA